MIRTMARIGAGLSFASFLVGGLAILAHVDFQRPGEGGIVLAIGLSFVGTACFVGPMLWLTAEKWAMKQQAPLPTAPVRPWPWKLTLIVICVIVGAMACLFALRLFAQPTFNPPIAHENPPR